MTREEGSARIWPLLVDLARNGRTCTYGKIAAKLEYKNARPIISMLGGIMWYCLDHGLPPLTIVVVNKRTCKPGDGLVLHGSVECETARVWDHNWAEERTPSMADYATANANHK